MLRRQLIQLFLQQNILRVHVGVNQTELGLIRGVLERSTDDLEHRCDTGTSCDHAEGTRECRCVGKLALGSFDTDFVTNFEEGDVFGNVALLVGLI